MVKRGTDKLRKESHFSEQQTCSEETSKRLLSHSRFDKEMWLRLSHWTKGGKYRPHLCDERKKEGLVL